MRSPSGTLTDRVTAIHRAAPVNIRIDDVHLRSDQAVAPRRMLRKIQGLVGDVEQPFSYGNVFSREVVRGVERLRIALDDGHQAFTRAVASRLMGPFQLTDSVNSSPKTAATISGFGY